MFGGSSGEAKEGSSGGDLDCATESSLLLQHAHSVEAAENSPNRDDCDPVCVDDDEDVPPMSVETFFDLVVAAAISTLSSLLLGKAPATNITQGLWFVLRVFFVFSIWHSCMIVNSAVDLYEGRRAAENGIMAVTFSGMFLVVAVVRTSQNDNNVLSGLVYVLGRLLVVILEFLETKLGEKRPSISDAAYQHFTRNLYLTSVLIPLECAPLLVSIVWFRNTSNGILIGGYITAIAFFLWRRIFARRVDEIPTYDHSENHIVNLNRVRERYETITLAVLGVFCILDPTEHSAYYVSFCAIVTAMAAFLLYFRARTRGRTEPWLVSAEASTQYPNLHMIIFCVIPSMSVAFDEIVLDQAATSDIAWVLNPHVLLCYFGGIFLVLIGLMDLLAQDPHEASKRPRLARRFRVAVYFVGGAALACCSQVPFVWYHSEIVVPIVFAIMASIQIWATRRPSDNERGTADGR